ncbi:MAG: YfiR family protein [Syntrophomonadaceae bacterium]
MKMNYLTVRKIAVAIIFLIGIMTINVYSQDMAVPVNLQAALFKKIFTFDKTLQAKGSLEVVVLSGDGAGDEIVTAFKGAGVNAKAVKGSQPPNGAAVVYVMPGVSAPKQACAQKGVLSISGVTSNVESGKVSISLGLEGGKPKIIVNLGQLKAEGQELSADLLKIAKVIQ